VAILQNNKTTCRSQPDRWLQAINAALADLIPSFPDNWFDLGNLRQRLGEVKAFNGIEYWWQRNAELSW